MIKQIFYYVTFKRAFKKLQSSQRVDFEKKLILFANNPFDPRLRTHKLQGKLEKYYSFSINYSERVVFEFINKETVGLVDIGPHRIYR